jgi:prevent-host-death family protein
MAQQDETRKDATEIQAEDARTGLADLLNRVGFSGETFVITRYGKPIAALIPMRDFDALAPVAPADTTSMERVD